MGEVFSFHPTDALAGYGPLARRSVDERATPRPGDIAPRSPAAGAAPRVALISNPKSHRNRNRIRDELANRPDLLFRAPQSRTELADTLAELAAQSVDLLIVDGGDGTIRDVMSAAVDIFGERMPRIALLPSGKTNALALDLGVPLDWGIDAIITAAQRSQFVARTPVEVRRADRDAPVLRGFLLGAGAFVRATSLAQHTHRLGAFNGLAVGLSLILAIGQTLLGSARNPWRRGEMMRVRAGNRGALRMPFYLVFASTLQALPLGLKPFGRVRSGLKLLTVAAPPRWLLAGVPALLTGSEAQWLDDAGYRRVDADRIELTTEDGFILDGEKYPGGDVVIGRGAPIWFVVP